MTALATRIAELAQLMEGTALTELRLTEGGETITLRREADAGPVAAAPSPLRDLVVAAPCPGVFLSRHPLHEDALVAPGEAVPAGTVLGLLRAGPLLLQVTAPRSGTLLATEAEDGALVGYGTTLFRLDPDAEDTPCPST